MSTDSREPMSREGRSRIGAAKLGIAYREYKAHIDAGLRRCYACKRWRPVEQMSKRASKVDGIDNICKACVRNQAQPRMARRYARRRTERQSA